MKELPNGYYAVDNGNELTDVFLYKGTEYKVIPGVNCFATVLEAMENAKAVPDTVLDGLDYESFSTPVLLLSAGEHGIKSFVFTKSLAILGQGASVSPNVANEDKLKAPTLNPLRNENESVLLGSYWHGKAFIEAPEIDKLIIDGCSTKMLRFNDNRRDAADSTLIFRNLIQINPCGSSVFNFGYTSSFNRTVIMQNNRVVDFDDMDYGAVYYNINAAKLVLDSVCFDNVTAFAGFTNMCRSFKNCSGKGDVSEIEIKNSYFGRMSGDRSISTSCPDNSESGVKLTITDSVFVDASPENKAVINPQMTNDKCGTVIKSCTFVDTRNNNASVVQVMGDNCNVEITDCTIQGFEKTVSQKDKLPAEAPDYIKIGDMDIVTEEEDPHKVIVNGDFSDIKKHYADRKVYRGDLHAHTSCGGTSDGKFPMKDWPSAMDEKKLDFAAIVDHKQMRGYFLPEWDDERFIIGTEPGTRFTDLNACKYDQSEIHYNMLFPHKYALAMVLANFPEFEFHGDELTGSFKYPKFTKARFAELAAYIQSIGGIVVHPHPKTMMASDDPMDYYLCDNMFLETIYWSYNSQSTIKNYNLWTKLLDMGKHVYTSCGSDTHGNVSNAAVATFYTKEKNGYAFFEQMRTADFTCGAFGMKMMIDGNPMGSCISYKDGMKLTLTVGDLFPAIDPDNTAYELRIITDKGVAYKSLFNGKNEQRISLEVEKRRFYRAEVYDLTHSYIIAIGNPIWLDKED